MREIISLPFDEIIPVTQVDSGISSKPRQRMLPPILVAICIAVSMALNIENQVIFVFLIFGVLISSLFMKSDEILLLAFSTWVFLPIGYISPDAFQKLFNVPTLLTLVYVIKTKPYIRPRGYLVLAVTLVFLSWSSIESVNSTRSFAWIFQVSIFLLCLVASRSQKHKIDTENMLRGVSYLAILIGLIAAIEFIFAKHFLYSGYILPSYDDFSKWELGSSFRIFTTLGHPLNNGLFFSTVGILLGRELLLGKVKGLYIFSFVLSVLGLLSSGSRAATVGLIIGISMIIVLRWSRITTGTRIAFLISSPAALFLVYASPWMQSFLFRVDSAEGQSSGTYRVELLQWIEYFWRYFATSGTGPGTSGTTWINLGNTAPLENGLLQLWVSLGLVPGILFISVLLIIGARGVDWKSTSWLVLIPILVYIPTTNFVEDASHYFAFFSLAVLIARIGTDTFESRKMIVKWDEKHIS